MSWGLLFFALLGLALAALWLAGRSRAATGLPAGRLVYADTTRWRPVERPLFSQAYRLTGRPDYLVRRRRDLIPVEVKSGRAPSDGPYPAHVLQLAVYCLLVAETYDRRPPYGVILYADDPGQAYEIDYTPALEEELLVTLDEMRLSLVEGGAPRDHDQPARCRACGYRSACDQALA
jgi:CRISPR-associated exonuclease Cas4